MFPDHKPYLFLVQRALHTDHACKVYLLNVLHRSRAERLHRLEVVSVYKEKKNAVIQYAEEKGIVVNRWPLERVLEDFHIGVVVSFGHLIPSNIINSFPL